MTMSQIFR